VNRRVVVKPGLEKPAVARPGLVKARLLKGGLKPRLVKPGLVKVGLLKPGLVKSGLVKAGLVKPGLVKARLVKSGLVKPCLMKPRPVKGGLDKPGLVKEGARIGPTSVRVVAVVAHELRTPLAAALMYMSMLERKIDAGAAKESIRPALTVAREQIQRLERLVTRVTEFQQFGKPLVRTRFVDVGLVISETVQRALAVNRDGKVSVDVDGCGVVGWWDDGAIEQIVQNLLSNALKFGAGRPIRITAHVAGPIGPAGRFDLQLMVQDEGSGIDVADLARIFRPFAHAPTHRAGGLGIGLWMVHQLVTAHGGSVTVRSRPGAGATFVVTMPERRPVERRPAAHAPVARPAISERPAASVA
jgi:two-component system, OmpR family, sensor kinase